MESEKPVVKIKDQKIKIVFTNELDENEKPLEMHLEIKREDDSKTVNIGIDTKLFVPDGEEANPTFMSVLYMDMLNIPYAIKQIFESNNIYEGLHVITREEYKEYLIKVKGLNIK